MCRRARIRVEDSQLREARLNRAIFHILALKSPLTVYDIYKEIKRTKNLKGTKYAVVNRRERMLEELNFLCKVGSKKTRAGFLVALYQLTPRGHLAMVFDRITLEKFIKEADDSRITAALHIFASY